MLCTIYGMHVHKVFAEPNFRRAKMYALTCWYVCTEHLIHSQANA